MKHFCWIPDYEDEHDAVDVDAFDAEQAAQLACERWHSRGRWAGDGIPGSIDVRVIEEGGSLYNVSVEVSFSVDFYSSKRVLMESDRAFVARKS